MDSITQGLYLIATIFLVLALLSNFLMSSNFPKLPGDIFINKPNIKVYIPFTSAIILSIILTLILNWFGS